MSVLIFYPDILGERPYMSMFISWRDEYRKLPTGNTPLKTSFRFL